MCCRLLQVNFKMARFFDITACLFQPPGFDGLKNNEANLRWNERIEFTCGDIEEYTNISDKISMYTQPTIKVTNKKVTSEDLMSTGGTEGLGTYDDAFSRSQKCMNTIQTNKLKAQTTTTSANGTPSSRVGVPKPKIPQVLPHPATAIPHMVIDKQDMGEAEYTILYFHANSEDIFTSLETTRFLEQIFRVA